MKTRPRKGLSLRKKKRLRFKDIEKSQITRDRLLPSEYWIGKDKIGTWLRAPKELGISFGQSKVFLKNSDKKGLLKTLSKEEAQKIANELVTEENYLPIAFQNIPFFEAVDFFHQTKRKRCVVRTSEGQTAIRYWILRLFKSEIISYQESRKAKWTKNLLVAVLAFLAVLILGAGIFVKFFSTNTPCYVYHKGIFDQKAKARWNQEEGWQIALNDVLGGKTIKPLRLLLSKNKEPAFEFTSSRQIFTVPATFKTGKKQAINEYDLSSLSFSARQPYRSLLGIASLHGVTERITMKIDWTEYTGEITREFFLLGEVFKPDLKMTFQGELRFVGKYWYCRRERFTVEQLGSWPRPSRKKLEPELKPEPKLEPKLDSELEPKLESNTKQESSPE